MASYQPRAYPDIARRVFPPADFLTSHGRLLCSDPTCSFTYSSRWHTCQRAVGPGQHRSGLLIDPHVVIAARRLPSAPAAPEPDDTRTPEPGDTPSYPTAREPTPATTTPPPPPGPYRHLPDCQKDPSLAGVAAAAARLMQPTLEDAQAFQAIMEEIGTLPVGTVAHVPRAARSLLAVVLADCLRAARCEGIWGFVRLMLLAKATL